MRSSPAALPLLAIAAVLGASAAPACFSEVVNPVPEAAADSACAGCLVTQPEGCGYSVTIDPARGSEATLDDGKLGTTPAPLRVRLGLGGGRAVGEAGYADPATTTAFLWDTGVDTTASKVRIGTSPDALTTTHTGLSYVLPGTVPVRIHRADACWLTPKTTYYYQVGGGPEGGETWSDVRSFKTLEGPSAAGRVVLGVTGDSRDSLETIWPLVQGRMANAAPDLQIFSGDSILLPLDSAEVDYAKWLDGAASAGALGAMQLVAIGGNHENMQAQWLANHALPGDGLTQGLFASFDVGPVHVVVVDDQMLAIDVPRLGFPEDTQHTIASWLEADLAAADARRDAVPWIVVDHHRGTLSTSNHGDDTDVLALRSRLMPVFDRYKVDLVLNGHDHNYERSKPVTGPAEAPVAQPDPSKGTVYIVCAGAGAGAYAQGTGEVSYRAVNARFGGATPYSGVYGLLTIDGRSLTFRAYGLKTSGVAVADDDVIDEVSWSK